MLSTAGAVAAIAVMAIITRPAVGSSQGIGQSHHITVICQCDCK